MSLLLIANTIDSTVLILSNHSVSTGILISKDARILTNYHAIKNKNNIKVAFKEKRLNYYDAKILKIDIEKDLVLIQIKNKKVVQGRVPIKLSNMDSLNLDDKIYSIGHPNKKLWQKSDGYIFQILQNHHWQYKDNKEHKLSFVIQAKLETNKGISGAPLLNNNNKLVGLIAFDNPKDKSIVYAISIYDIKEFLFK